MKIVFFGSSNFSCAILKTLLGLKMDISLVITQPAQPAGRGLKKRPTPVEVFCRHKGLKAAAPANLKDGRFVEEVKSAGPDIFLVISYGKILPPEVLALPKIITLGIHPSLLPKYRVAAPINWVLIIGE